MLFVKLLLKFLFNLLFNKGEYEVTNKNFNPVRVLLIPLILLYAFWVTVRLFEYREVIEENCDVCIVRLDTVKTQEIEKEKRGDGQ